MKTYDIAIVGAGIVGAACAAALSRASLSVVIIDKDAPATGVTAAGMGHIVVMDDSAAQFALTNFSQTLWRELSDELPATCEYDHSGTIWVAADAEELKEVRRKHEFYKSREVKTEILDQQLLVEAEPNLATDLAGGLLVPGDSVVYQPAATHYLVKTAVASGAEVRCGKAAVRLDDTGVMLENNEFIPAGKIVNAAGDAAHLLSPQLRIRPRKGHLVITERYEGFVKHQLVELGYLKSAHSPDRDSVAFNIQPRKTGQILLGSSRQFDATDKQVDFDILRRMTSRAYRFMPRLRGLAATRVWTGFRPATPDNLPYIGKVPGFQNVFAAAGHEGLGITTSLGTAELLAAEIMGRTPAIPVEAYSPTRAIVEH